MSLVPRVLVAHGDLPQPAIDLLEKENFDVTVMDVEWPKVEDILKVIQDYDAVIGMFRVDAKFLDQAGKRLKVIATLSAGSDHLDLPAIKERGIKVGNTSRVSSAAVADIAIYLLLATIRRAHEMCLLLKEGRFRDKIEGTLGYDLQNKTVGIVGLGGIGEAVARRLVPFEVKKILYTGHARKQAGDRLGAEFVSLNKLLEESDVVVNCAPLTEETEGMFDDEAFGRMKSTAVFVNVGRGRIVDTEALVRALKENRIYAAGLDVTDPVVLPVDHELLRLPNAVVTPHIGCRTFETVTNMAIVAARNVVNGLRGEPLLSEL